jgi:ABC-type uncharacterized transport system permease subunit
VESLAIVKLILVIISFYFLIQVALASGIQPAAIEIVRQTQLHLHLRNVKIVDAKGLNLKRDGLHLTTASQVSLGQKLADAFLS